jgi:MoaA/NifB/PqqE/SkfB family radical SAM enzyme
MIKSYKNLNNLLSLSWQLTMKCNYHCPYCSQKESKNKFIFLSQEEIEKIALRLKETIIFNNIPVRIHLTGGEPTLYNLSNIIKILDNDLIKNYSITTNLSKDLVYYYKLSKVLKKQISFSASLHETECDIEEFIKKANLIPNLKVYMVATETNQNVIEKVSKKLKCEYIIRPEHDKNFNLINFSFIKNNRNSNYVEIEDESGVRIFSNQSDIWKKYGAINFNGYKCKRNYYKIKPNGDIYNGSCSFIVNQKSEGNILKDIVKFNPKEIICNSNMNCNLCGKIEVYK